MKEGDNIEDQELQNLAESGMLNGTYRDSRAYRLVFEALKKETEFSLPATFSQSVLQRMEAAEGKNSYVWLAVIFTGFIVAAGVSIALTDFRPDFGFLRHISRFAGLFVFGAAFILLLQWIDRKVIHGKPAGI
jgi:hypothetical protein